MLPRSFYRSDYISTYISPANPLNQGTKLTFIFELMIEIQYPDPAFKVKHQNDVPYIFDIIRKRWLVLQDEEWVRQNFVQYLLQTMQYPQSLIALEKEIRLGELKKRFDILVYDTSHKPWMLVECKADKINLKDDVLNQALRYNIAMPAKYLLITNGKQTYGWAKKNGTLETISELPVFNEMG